MYAFGEYVQNCCEMGSGHNQCDRIKDMATEAGPAALLAGREGNTTIGPGLMCQEQLVRRDLGSAGNMVSVAETVIRKVY